MSNSGSTAADSPASRGVPRSAPIEAPNHTRTRNERSTGKGRRRRAAAEQRRIEQQRWGQYVGDDDNEDFAVAPAPVNRRRSYRSSRRRNSGQEALDDYLNENPVDDLSEYGSSFSEDSSLDVALALAISLSGSASANQGNAIGLSASDMSYENLVLLEDVKIVAPPLVVNSLQEIFFEGTENQSLSDDSSGVCAVCQSEYVIAEKLIVLPCCHNFHHACGAEWLLNYSKLCPICKHDVTV